MNPENDQFNIMKQWLAHAPQVPPLAAGKKWHVFLSYRSVHRDWALHLYDALSQAGFTVFLDQFQLVAGASLASSLAQALSESESGVIVWSSEAADSQWCQCEYDTMLTMQTRPGSGFQCERITPRQLSSIAPPSAPIRKHEAATVPPLPRRAC